MRLTVLGCGDAFGSGGRLQTSYHVAGSSHTLLIDCGATALIGLDRAGLAANDVDTILISHLHGDHFAGLVWWMLHAQHVARREHPLVVAGPLGIEARTLAAMEVLFPGSSLVPRRFELRFVEMRQGTPTRIGDLEAHVFEVRHPSGAPSHAMRMALDGRSLAFSGDTEWVDVLSTVAAGADLFITECYAHDKESRYHMNWRVLSQRLPGLGARKVLVTHMSHDMLAHRDKARAAGLLVAEDGMVLEV